MTATSMRAVALLVAPIACGVVGCGPTTSESQEPQRWSGLVEDVRVQWTSEPGINLTEGAAVPLRAYLESYNLVQFTGDLELAYPGFLDAVPPNEEYSQTNDDVSAYGRRPSENVAATTKLAGNLRFHVQSIEAVDGSVIATLCNYRYGIGLEGADSSFETIGEGNDPVNQGIYGIRVTLTNPNGPPSEQGPLQSGDALSPDDSVFGDWQVIGNLTTSASSPTQWPDRDAVEAACVANAPDPVERRRFLVAGQHPESEFEPSPPIPGWP